MLLLGSLQLLILTSQLQHVAGFPFLEKKWKESKYYAADNEISTFEKRTPTYRKIDVSGIHAFQPPGPNDK